MSNNISNNKDIVPSFNPIPLVKNWPISFSGRKKNSCKTGKSRHRGHGGAGEGL